MIDVSVKIHDKFSIEFKVGVNVDYPNSGNYAVNTWVFVPKSLDINSVTYTKQQFYTDVKTHIRLITPRFILGNIAAEDSVPYQNLRNAFENLGQMVTAENIAEYEYQIKMFSAIVKSALRDAVKHIANARPQDVEYLSSEFLNKVKFINLQYENLKKIINIPTVSEDMVNCYSYGEEFIVSMSIAYLGKLSDELKQKRESDFTKIETSVIETIEYLVDHKRRKGYLEVEKDNTSVNDNMVFRQGVLKKYVESGLFLDAETRRDGVWVEQIYYSLAAGLAMLFATIVSFSFQRKFGSLTMPLFVALILSYMLKDRIKELMRYYFAHRLGKKYFDNKTTISIKDKVIGSIREGFDFITENHLPEEVRNIRNKSHLVDVQYRISNDRILLYRKLIHIDSEQLALSTPYFVNGLNDITRLNLISFTRQMDNPDVWLRVVDDGKLSGLFARKMYYINIVMQFNGDGNIEYKRFRVGLNRDGIAEINEVK